MNVDLGVLISKRIRLLVAKTALSGREGTWLCWRNSHARPSEPWDVTCRYRWQDLLQQLLLSSAAQSHSHIITSAVPIQPVVGLWSKSERELIHFWWVIFHWDQVPKTVHHAAAQTVVPVQRSRGWRKEWMGGGQQELSLSRLKQPCCWMCNHSLIGSLIVPLL